MTSSRKQTLKEAKPDVASVPRVDQAYEAASLSHDRIAEQAYLYWQARGCPEGSPEEDWFRAEQELRKKAASAAAPEQVNAG